MKSETFVFVQCWIDKYLKVKLQKIPSYFWYESAPTALRVYPAGHVQTLMLYCIKI